ncbi:hypothetical protein BJX61DRAFT_544720 [Aspergillus egyptiacus]|nr:hypothetical protein BJX61DRAFT_544720 [Aspergillus egyptiacus]
MHLSSAYLAIFATSALGYRIFEYTGERCTGSQVGLHRLAGPSGCDQLNNGIASSVLVKIDNIHDDQYAVNVYDNDDCTGSIVGHIRNMNGCLNLSPFSTVGQSIKVIPAQQSAKMHAIVGPSASEGFETDYLYNLRSSNAEQMKVPIAHGLFRTVDKANHTENGVYENEAFDIFLPTELENVSRIQKQWTNPSTEEGEDEGEDDDISAWSVHSHSAPADLLDTRQFEWAYCNFEALCLGAISLSYRVRNSQTAQAAFEAFRDHPWLVIAQGVDFLVARAASGITIIGTITGSGGESPSKCDSGGNPGSLAKDLINSAKSEGLTNALWQVTDENGRLWEVALQVHEEGKENSDNCGACPTCL